MREVAKKAGVSPTTVSHVINNTRYVSEEVRTAVLAAMEELDYRPNELARSLRRGQTMTVGLILPDSANPFFAEIGRSIERAAFDLKYSVILCNTEGDLERERLYVDVLRKKQVDGIIFVAAGDRTESLHRLLRRKFPIVLVDRDLPGVKVDAVLVDNHHGGRLALEHLLTLGHHRIGCIAGPSNVTPSAERITGYRQALENAGVSFDPKLVIRGDFHPNSGREAALAMLAQPDPPTAIFACNDLMAIGAMRAAAESGRRIPNDLALVGFDDIELASYTTPQLTTVAQPTVEIGQIAIQFLIERINNGKLPARRKQQLPELVIRGTCGGQS